MNSPWGAIDACEEVAPGVSWISTPSHGGLRIVKTVAAQRLSQAARNRAIVQNDACWFEEDCLYAVAAYELEDLWPRMFRSSPDQSTDDRRRELLHIISSYKADYLLERHIEPDPAGFAYWLVHQLEDVLGQLRQVDPQSAQRLIPNLDLVVDIEGGVCCSIHLEPHSTTLLHRLGIDVSYRVNDRDLLEETVS